MKLEERAGQDTEAVEELSIGEGARSDQKIVPDPRWVTRKN
jgi:hypothetical protein